MWQVVWYDVPYKVKTKLDLLSVSHLQIYNSMAEIASAMFGGDKKNEPVKINDLPAQQAVDTINHVLSMAGGG